MIEFSEYLLIPLISFIVNLILTTYVFAKHKENELNLAYFFFSLSLTCWSFMDLIFWSRVGEQYYDAMVKFAAIIWHGAGFSFLNFSYVFVRKARDRLYRFLLGFTLLSLIITLSTNWVIDGYRTIVIAIVDNPGVLHLPLVFVVTVFPIIYGIYLMLRVRAMTDDSERRSQILVVVTGTLIGTIITLGTLVIIPDVLKIEGILPLQDIGFLLNSLFIFIAITKYHFMSLKISDVAEEVFSVMTDGIMVVDELGRVRNINQVAAQILRQSPSVIEEQRPQIVELLPSFPSGWESFKNVELSNNGGGQVAYLSVSKSRAFDAKGETVSIVTLSDITQRKQAELDIIQMNHALELARDKALESSKMKSQFLANMSHELRTPLNAIIGYSEIIIEDAYDVDNAQVQDDARKIHTSGKHLLSLINDVLDLSKIEAGKMDVFYEPMEVALLMNDMAALAAPLVEKNQNILNVHQDPSVSRICTDVLKLRQVLINLLSNAAKFTHEGSISLTVEKADEGHITFAIRDTGIGISQDKLSGLFDAFTQADASTTRKYGGTGLGLALSKRFVEMLKGEILVDTIEGEGSCFSIVLPLDASQN